VKGIHAACGENGEPRQQAARGSGAAQVKRNKPGVGVNGSKGKSAAQRAAEKRRMQRKRQNQNCKSSKVQAKAAWQAVMAGQQGKWVLGRKDNPVYRKEEMCRMQGSVSRAQRCRAGETEGSELGRTRAGRTEKKAGRAEAWQTAHEARQ